MAKSIYIRFDWAMKRLLRDKANHEVLEGFITSLIGRKFTIVKFLESESNAQDSDDKFNRVDILAENEDKELVILEIQNDHETTYFHRMLYGVSKVITDYINLGDDYGRVRKVYSINIVYFELGQGEDYVYHGYTTFKGLHEPHDTLRLTIRQTERFLGIKMKHRADTPSAGELFPEYYVLRVNDFDQTARTPLDEWISFFKTGDINPDYKAPGMERARQCLRVDSLTKEEYASYFHHMDNLVYARSALESSFEKGMEKGKEEGIKQGKEEGIKQGKEEGIKQGKEEGIKQGMKEGIKQGMEKGIEKGKEEGRSEMLRTVVQSLIANGMTPPVIARTLHLKQEEVDHLLEEQTPPIFPKNKTTHNI